MDLATESAALLTVAFVGTAFGDDSELEHCFVLLGEFETEFPALRDSRGRASGRPGQGRGPR